MKTLFSWLFIAAIILFAACSDEAETPEFDPRNATVADFVGAWSGTGQSTIGWKGTEHLTLTLIPFHDGTTIMGFIESPESGKHQIIGQSVSQGEFSFSLANDAPLDPMCQTWTAHGKAHLKSKSSMHFTFSGTFCNGDTGSVSSILEYTGSAAVLDLYAFGKVGNRWKYEVTRFNATQCQLTMEITNNYANGLFGVQGTNTCGWTTAMNGLWYIAPFELNFDVPDTALAKMGFVIPYNVPAGTDYLSTDGTDTILLTVVATGQFLEVPAGSFRCNKIHKEVRAHSDPQKSMKGDFWINNEYGLIKYQQQYPSTPTDVLKEELIEINF
ncbi:MAG: hypothetical protein FJY10_05255 [Bacteroidetes bacterium]|nr:hypothetical protein [Bacteroidota bacterium]